MFPIVCAGGETILAKVFPSKQADVHKIIAIASADARIKKIILFGSSVTLHCGCDSDVDIAIDADVSPEEFLQIAHQFYVGVKSEIDVVHLSEIKNELLKKEITEKGIVIYGL